MFVPFFLLHEPLGLIQTSCLLFTTIKCYSKLYRFCSTNDSSKFPAILKLVITMLLEKLSYFFHMVSLEMNPLYVVIVE